MGKPNHLSIQMRHELDSERERLFLIISWNFCASFISSFVTIFAVLLFGGFKMSRDNLQNIVTTLYNWHLIKVD